MGGQSQPSFALRIVVPFRQRDAKTGLSKALTRRQREDLARTMLTDVLDACGRHEREVVTPEPMEPDRDVRVVVDESPLNEALERRLDLGLPILILPADLPLLRRNDVEELLSAEGDVVIAPGLRGGTNALLLRKRIPLNYGGRSFPRHVAAAGERGLDVTVHESFRFAVDIDEPEDLIEIRLHGEGAAQRYLDTNDPRE